jgi:hypothetical protein
MSCFWENIVTRIWAPRDVDVWGSGRIAPRILKIGTRWGDWLASHPGRFIPEKVRIILDQYESKLNFARNALRETPKTGLHRIPSISIYLPIYALFDEVVSSLDHEASNDRMINAY